MTSDHMVVMALMMIVMIGVMGVIVVITGDLMVDPRLVMRRSCMSPRQ
jgi:hypothetical protein